MKTELKIADFNCVCIPNKDSKKIVYMIYPAIVPLPDEWLQDMSVKYNVQLVVIYIPAYGWNDMLTPWPEPGETPDSPPFSGQAAATLDILKNEVVPQTEKALGIANLVSRNLIGVSLSGLFTIWQWVQSDLFDSVASLSGSFWYPGFIEWFEKQEIPHKEGFAYFLLGVKEPKAWIKAYRSVGVNTESVVAKLKACGISTTFEWVPGNHIADPLGRAEAALAHF